MSQKIRLRLNCAGCIESLIGGRSENQDSAGCANTPLGDLIIVCDGMGGLKGGKYASSLAVKTVIEYVSSVPEDSNPVETMKVAVDKANSAVYTEGRKEDYKGMGTTLVALLLTPASAIVAQVGDSRVYQLRSGKKVFRTSDHSMVFDMVRANVITEEQARLSDCSNIILKAIGVNETVEPDIVELPYCRGDRFVLCTDGFWGAVDEPTLLKMLSRKGNLENRLQSVAREFDKIGKENGGGHDNLTAAVIDVYMNSRLKEKRSAKGILPGLIPYALLVVSIGLNIWLAFTSHDMKKSMDTVHAGLDSLYSQITEVNDSSAVSILTTAKVKTILELMEKPESQTDTTEQKENTTEQ